MNQSTSSSESFTPYQKFVVGILAFLQFTIVLDFMILAPLGATMMPALGMTASQFGGVVSAYAFSAGLSGFLAAGFADRFDRKKLLLFFYSGFILGTLYCALAPSFFHLVAARIVTGLFAGVIGSVIFAITTDLFPLNMRGRVMGFVQTAFAVSQVVGIPLGLVISNRWGWHSPFLMIVGIGTLVGIIIFSRMQPIDAHLKLAPDRSAVSHLVDTVSQPLYLQAFGATALLATGGFMMMPFGSAFSVNNLGITLEQLPFVYMITGACNIVMGPLIGRLSDTVGKMKVFGIGTFLGIIVALVYTQLGVTPLWLVVLILVLLFATITCRMITCSAMMSAVPEPRHRGSFMSVSSSVQQVSGGIASALAGMIVIQEGNGPLKNFDILGYVVSGAMVVTWVQIYFVEKKLRATQRLT